MSLDCRWYLICLFILHWCVLAWWFRRLCKIGCHFRCNQIYRTKTFPVVPTIPNQNAFLRERDKNDLSFSLRPAFQSYMQTSHSSAPICIFNKLHAIIKGRKEKKEQEKRGVKHLNNPAGKNDLEARPLLFTYTNNTRSIKFESNRAKLVLTSNLNHVKKRERERERELKRSFVSHQQ